MKTVIWINIVARNKTLRIWKEVSENGSLDRPLSHTMQGRIENWWDGLEAMEMSRYQRHMLLYSEKY